MEKKYFSLLGLVLLLLFLLLSFIIHQDYFRDMDYESMHYLQNTISRRWDLVFSIFTPLGSSEVTTAIVLSFFIYLFWKKKILALSLLLFFLINLIELIGKTIIFHPDPPAFLNRYSLGLYFPSSFIVHTNFSFPSGHMARITFVTFLLIFMLVRKLNLNFKNKILSTLLFVVFVGMFVSRIYLGEHWFSDVLGGMLLGGGLVSLAIGLM